jgi:hypothetical protein
MQHVQALRPGDVLELCSAAGKTCVPRRLPVVWTDDGLRVGPCDLSGETSRRWYAPFETPLRTISLLDLYHYDEECVPKRIAEDERFWPYFDRNGRAILPLRSFLILRGEEVLVALLDEPGLAQLSRGQGIPSPVADSVAPEEDTNGGSFEVTALELRIRVPFTALYAEQRSFARADPDPDRYCEDGYASEGGDSLSGSSLCKRIEIFYRPHRVTLFPERDSVRLVLGEPSTISVPARCAGPVGPDGLEQTPSCSFSDIETIYASGPGDLLRAQARPDAVRAMVLAFPQRLHHGEPIRATLSIGATPQECDDLEAPCLQARTRRGTTLYPLGETLALGPQQAERHFLHAQVLHHPWWIMWLVGGWLLLHALLLPVPKNQVAFSLSFALVVLLTARALFGYKVAAYFPHDPEGLASALVGLAIFPSALLVAGLEGRNPRAAWAMAALTIIGLIGVALLGDRQIISFDGSDRLLMFGAPLALVTALFFARGGPPRWLSSLISRAWALGVRHRRKVAVIGLAVLVGLRFLASWTGRERIVGVPWVAVYWPLAILALAVLIPEIYRRCSARPWLALCGTLALAAVVVGFQFGDWGAVMVLGPSLFLGIFLTTAEPQRRCLGWGSLSVAVLLLGGAWLLHVQLGAEYPPLIDEDKRWELKAGSSFYCPMPSGKLEQSMPFSESTFESFQDVFALDNRDLRRDDYLRPGSANSAGTREGARVHESIAIMKRYAAGPGDAFLGAGFLASPVRRYGAAEVDAQLFDAAPSVLLASEGGTAAVAGLALLHLGVLFALLRDWEANGFDTHSAGWRFGALASGALPVWATLLMLGGNFGLLPFTGQSTPELAVLSGADLVLTPTLWCLSLAFAAAAVRKTGHA